MEFPECPLCAKGRLIPISAMYTDYHTWVCTRPDCRYAIGDDLKYYKGRAATEEVKGGEKDYIEFDF